jgi:hypothetical protein
MAVRLSTSIPTPTLIYAHSVWVAAIGATIFGVGFATWDGWLSGVVVAVAWFAASVLFGRRS